MSLNNEFADFTKNVLDDLKTKSFEKLSSLDGHFYKWEKKKRSGVIGIAIEEIDKNSIRVIIQGSLPFRFLSFLEYPYVDGFRVNRYGKIEDVTYDEISHFD